MFVRQFNCGTTPKSGDFGAQIGSFFMKFINNLHNFLKSRCYDRDSVQKEYQMKNIWKWILGIILVLVVVTALVAVPFIMRNTMAANFSIQAAQQSQTAPEANPQGNGGPMMNRNFDGQRQGPGGFGNQRGPMMGNGRNFERGFSRFGGFAPLGFGFMFLGGLLRLIPLALLGLLLYGVYQLGKRAGVRSTYVPAPVSTQVEPPAVSGGETPAA
jgi:hypothetical protein